MQKTEGAPRILTRYTRPRKAARGGKREKARRLVSNLENVEVEELFCAELPACVCEFPYGLFVVRYLYYMCECGAFMEQYKSIFSTLLE